MTSASSPHLYRREIGSRIVLLEFGSSSLEAVNDVHEVSSDPLIRPSKLLDDGTVLLLRSSTPHVTCGLLHGVVGDLLVAGSDLDLARSESPELEIEALKNSGELSGSWNDPVAGSSD